MTNLDAIADVVLGALPDTASGRVQVSSADHGLTRFANSHVHQHVGERTTTTDLQVMANGRVVDATTTVTDDDGLRAFVTRTVALAAAAPVDPAWPGLAPGDVRDADDRIAPSTADATPDDRAELVAAFVEAGRGLNAAGYCETVVHDVLHANSLGRRRRARTSRATLDGIHRTDSASGSAHATARGLDAIDATTLGQHAATRARRGENQVDLPPGEYPVVLGPEPVATIAVFLAMYGLNARAVQEGRSSLDVGVELFDRAFRLADDVGDPRSVDLPFDLEGTDRSRVELIADGRVVGLSHDRRTAAAAGGESTGNHVAGSSSMGPLATSLVVEPGDVAPTRLLDGVERGVYVTAFNYCRVLDPKTLVVTGLTRNGTFLVEDGRVTRPLGNLRFTQSFTAALAPGRVLAVGNDDRFADSEFGPGLVIAPSMRLGSWQMTGNQSG